MGIVVIFHALNILIPILAHPDVAYILLVIGIYGLLFEFSIPGVGVSGVLGAVCLIFALFALRVLPVNAVGLVLIALGVFLCVMEHVTPSHGLLTFFGLGVFALGSHYMIDVSGGTHPRVSWTVILSGVTATGLFFGLAVKWALAARKQQPKTGVESLIGLQGVATTDLNPGGMVFLNGELWKAKTEGPAVNKDENVFVVQVHGHTLIVRKS